MTAQEARKMTNAFKPKSYLSHIISKINNVAREGGGFIYDNASDEDIKDLKELGYKVIEAQHTQEYNSALINVAEKFGVKELNERGITVVRISW